MTERRGIQEFITPDPMARWELELPVDLIELGPRVYVALCRAEAQARTNQP